ncbi:MAG: hypothetical protein M1839_007858 [Geoglossum umbratile]|nr:MAG: hypothetical protein M1839_007858 [Geoglossum umbratile]
MREKGYKPLDVWLDNIKAMLELGVDLGDGWMEELQKHAYPDDTRWFISHMQMFYLALCTPPSQDDEFLLTEGAFGVHEGPASLQTHPDTGEPAERYTEYHVFAVISPKSMLGSGETVQQLNVRQHKNTLGTNSVLADLPITKARISYSKIADGRLALLDGEGGTRRAYHKFCFRFFLISTEYVNKINGPGILLEAASHKLLQVHPEYVRMTCLNELEQAAREMGSHTAAVTLGQGVEGHLPGEPSESMKLYMKLGGSTGTYSKDPDQADKMLRLRVKIDVWSQDVAEHIGGEIHASLRNLFC